MRSHELRVVAEYDELKRKRVALASFILESLTFQKLPSDEQKRLQQQYRIMIEYGSILQDRIAHFPPSASTVREITAEENLPEIPTGPAVEGLEIANVTKIEECK